MGVAPKSGVWSKITQLSRNILWKSWQLCSHLFLLPYSSHPLASVLGLVDSLLIASVLGLVDSLLTASVLGVVDSLLTASVLGLVDSLLTASVLGLVDSVDCQCDRLG